MPPRLNKRQQRELEELSNLGGSSPVEEIQSSSDEDAPELASRTESTKKLGGFAALAQPEGDVDEQETSEPQQPTKSKKPRKKKKKTAPSTPIQHLDVDSKEDSVIETVSEPRTHNDKPTPKRSKVKGKSKKKKEDDLDQILAELSIKHPEYQRVSSVDKAGPSSTSNGGLRLNQLLAVSLAQLDSEAEMRRFFGSKVVSATNAETKAARRPRGVVQNLKSNLTKPQSTWWAASQREGLSGRPLTQDELSARVARGNLVHSDEKWWTVEYSKRYRGVTKAFVNAVMSGDPEQFWRIIQILPWHGDTLLQLSEVYRHQEEHAQSVDYLNRALFTYERAFIGAFTFATGANRLDFDRVESRPFYLAVARMITDLQRRGCVRSAFEFGRLLLSLDPYTDPHGAYLYLDFLAIKGHMHQWMLDIWNLHESQVTELGKEFNVTALPGWAFARAMALRVKEDADRSNHDGSSEALKEAIQAFPSVVPLLADKTDVVLLPELRAHPSFRVHTDADFARNDSEALIHLLSHLYVQRSHTIWKLPENASWFKTTANSAFSSVDRTPPLRKRFDLLFPPSLSMAKSPLALSIYRHCLLLDHNTARRFTAFFPRSVMAAPNMSCDPLPPKTSLNCYDQSFFTGAEDPFGYRPRTRRQREMDDRILGRILPDPQLRGQLQAIFNDNVGFRNRFPGGLIEFLQMEPEMAEQMLENIMVGNAAFEGQEGFEMPGGFEQGGGGAMQMDEDIDRPIEAAIRRHDNAHVDVGEGLQDREDSDDFDEFEEEREEDEDAELEEDDAPILPVRMLRNIVSRFWGGNTTSRGDESDSDENETAELRDNIDVD